MHVGKYTVRPMDPSWDLFSLPCSAFFFKAIHFLAGRFAIFATAGRLANTAAGRFLVEASQEMAGWNIPMFN